MTTTRMEAFSDGVLAIIITIMVLELKVPHNGFTLQALQPLIPVFLSYVLSFIYVGIYWNNHHHLLHAVKHVNGKVLWCNLHLLFWLSLIPFTTSWVGEHYKEVIPIASYGFVLMMAGVAYYCLVLALIKVEGRDSAIAKSIGNDFKGKISVVFCIIGISLSFINTWIGIVCYIIVACVWFVPDNRIEKN
ncbi:TMEM175 family protein [Pedobacter heparinus]|uniref:TMEM175 family protein n=1 Tax=Pedobacter heparinus TaxID=984 RepID=UPI002931358A|nr:TMEM175 family protein [Pedobacter heparinus]